MMKKALSKAGMTESEFEAVRKIMKQGILNIQPLSIFFVETSLEKSSPCVAVLDVQPSKLKRKFERLVEAVTTKTKGSSNKPLDQGKDKRIFRQFLFPVMKRKKNKRSSKQRK